MARAEKAIRDAIAASPALSTRDIVVFPQGSYRNRTSVPRESDVDICVMTRDVVIVVVSEARIARLPLTFADRPRTSPPATCGRQRDDSRRVNSDMRGMHGEPPVRIRLCRPLGSAL